MTSCLNSRLAPHKIMQITLLISAQFLRLLPVRGLRPENNRKSIDVFVTVEGNVEFTINGSSSPPVTNLNLTDGQWHHICLVWYGEDNGQTRLYSDGEFNYRLDGNGTGVINADGVFIVGQDLNENGGSFNESRAFVGMITGVNMWFKSFDIDTIASLSRVCLSDIEGYPVKWRGFKNGFHRNVQLINAPECQMPDFTFLSRRNQRCSEKHFVHSPSCTGPMRALFDRVNLSSGKMWRCYHECSVMISPDHGGYIFNPDSGKDNCVINAHEELLTIDIEKP